MKSLGHTLAIFAVLVVGASQAHGQWQTSGTKVFYNGGNVGIGTNNPSQKLHVKGNLRVTGWIGNSGAGSVQLRSSNKRVGLLQYVSITDIVTFTSANVILGSERNSVSTGVLGATISGGGGTAAGINQGNQVQEWYGAIGGGYNNLVSGDSGVVAGGNFNVASGDNAAIGGGTGNEASGFNSNVPGGNNNMAAGSYAFAAGRRAKALHIGAFVWGDATDSDVSSTAPNQFTARTTGGARFLTNSAGTAGVEVTAGSGAWSSLCDRNAKENFEKIDARQIVEKVAGMPMMTWNYKSQDKSIRHIGPMAQDFHEAFGVGENELRITTIDADGVALAAIQGLHQMLKDKDVELAQMKERLNKLEALLSAQTNQHSAD